MLSEGSKSFSFSFPEVYSLFCLNCSLLSHLPFVCLIVLLLFMSLILVMINSLLELVSVFSLDTLVLRRATVVIVLSRVNILLVLILYFFSPLHSFPHLVSVYLLIS